MRATVTIVSLALLGAGIAVALDSAAARVCRNHDTGDYCALSCVTVEDGRLQTTLDEGTGCGCVWEPWYGENNCHPEDE